MQAIKHLYKIGNGPSSSHTIAPYRIASLYKENFGNCNKYEIELGGSLALTAKGHGTLSIIENVLETNNISYKYNFDTAENNINIMGYIDDIPQTLWHGLSLGGGSIEIKEFHTDDNDEIYNENNFESIKQYLIDNNCSLLEYVYIHEPNLKKHLLLCLNTMFDVVNNGLNKEGLLNKDLNYYRVAKKLYEKCETKNDYLVAYSYAAMEENAAGGLMCTAPTLGACGILTSLMYYLRFNKNESLDHLCDMLAIAGVFGNCIKTNASIAGSTGGCQAEVGTACAMASAALAFHYGAELNTIEYAAEMGIEHFLGLTCDPVMGYVIIPCIERNAISILRAYDCCYLAEQLNNVKDNAVSFDSVVNAMNYTGSKIAMELKETSLGGLSLEFKK